MKKFFTLLAALFMATTMMGQMHGPMKFVGASNMSVSSTAMTIRATPYSLRWLTWRQGTSPCLP